MLSRTLTTLVAAAIVTATGVAKAESPLEACLASYERVQHAQKEGLLVTAQRAVEACLRPECPELLRADCESWQRTLKADTPSIVVEVEGAPSAHAWLDDAEITPGVAIPVNPGTHVVRAEQGAGRGQSTVVIARGEIRRRVTVLLRAAEPERPAHATGFHPPPLFWIATSVAVVGAASFATFGSLGRSRHGDLESSCGTRCSQDAVSEVSRLYVVADVSLLVSAVFAGVAVWSGLSSPVER